MTPGAVAELCGVSHRKLHTALTETLGVTPAALLRTIRLERARLRLSRPGLVDMNAIARQAGYSTARWFSDAFRRQFGQTPDEMREHLYGSHGSRNAASGARLQKSSEKLQKISWIRV